MRELFYLLVFISIYILIQLIKGEAIFVPLPKNTIRKMLKLAKAGKNDLLYDLGSGDGRVLIIAAKEFGCRAIGIERNFFLYLLSKYKAKKAKVEDRVKILHGDFFNQNISDATIIFLYLSKKIVNKLKAKFEKELKKGTRIVSADHKIENWKFLKRIKTGHFFSYLYKV